MPELYFDIKFRKDQASYRKIADDLNDIQTRANQSAQAGTDAATQQTKATQVQAQAQKELNDKFRRLLTLNEVRFRQGKISQQQALKNANLLQKAAINQDVLNDETVRGVQLQKTMFLSQQRIETGFTGMAMESKRANLALINLGRIVQDLPFGFLGISNNIDPALNSMKQLKDESGGTMSAMKLLLTSLKGSGGLIFALGSLLPTAMLISQRGFNMYKKKAVEAKDALQELNEATRGFINESAQLRFDEGGFLSIFELEAKIESTNKLISLFSDEVAEVERQVKASGLAYTAFGSSISDRRPLEEARSNLEIIQEQFKFTDDEIKNITKSLDGFQTQLNIARIRRAQDDLAVFKDALSATARNFDFLSETGAITDQQFQDFRQSLIEQRDSLRDSAIVSEEAKRKYELLNEVIEDTAETYEEATVNLDGYVYSTETLMMQLDFQIAAQKKVTDRVNESIEARRKLREEELKSARQQEELIRNMPADERDLIGNEGDGLKAFADRAEQMKKIEEDLAQFRIATNMNVASAINAINQGIFGDSKAFALIALAIEKAQAISEVIIEGTKQAFKAKALAAAYTAAAQPQLAALANAQAVKIKALTAVNVAAIAAQTLGEAGGVLSSGGGGGFGASSPAQENRQQGFFESDPQRPRGIQPINLILDGEFDEEVLSIKAQRGSNKRKRGTQFAV